jgi:hypothetical protein
MPSAGDLLLKDRAPTRVTALLHRHFQQGQVDRWYAWADGDKPLGDAEGAGVVFQRCVHLTARGQPKPDPVEADAQRLQVSTAI